MSSGSPETTNVTDTCHNNNGGDENSGATTQNEQNNNNDSNNLQNRTSSSVRRADSRKTVLSNNERTWEGDTPEIGAVLGLRTEYLNKKTSFSVFMEKMEEYILRKLNNGSDVLPLVRDQKDPSVVFETKHLPKDLSAVDKQSEVKVEVHKQRIKMYVNREIELGANMLKVYGLVKGQCSHSLKAVLKRENDYGDKDGARDVLWLLKR